MALIAEKINFWYRADRPVLSDISVEIPSGCVTSILGPNGAGKSTLIRLMAGVARPRSGRVCLDGGDLQSMPLSERAAKLAFAPQRPNVGFAYSVRQVVGFGLLLSRSGRHRRIDQAMDQLSITDLADEPMLTLSVGQQQRVVLARALCQLAGRSEGGYLLADEPTSAMDPAHAHDALNLISELAHKGAGVAIVQHDLTQALSTADRVVMLDDKGDVAQAGTAQDTLIPEKLTPIFGVEFAVLTGPDSLRAVVPITTQA